MKAMTRHHFLKLLLAGAAFAPELAALGASVNELRGDRVGWARLKTRSKWWFRHANGDPTLMRFFREHTTLNIDPTWYVADVQDLGEMCKYPLLFSQGIHVVKDNAGQSDLVEFMRRGGFLLVDACCNIGAMPDPDVFLDQHIALLQKILPEAHVVELPANHPIYQCVFKIPNGHPPHTFWLHRFDARKARHGLYGVMTGERMAGLISLSGLQCGWSPLGEIPPPPGHDVACMKMLVNIYIYAMLQNG